MDIHGINSHLFGHHSSRGLKTANVEKMSAVQDDCNSLFINYAAIAWHEMRRAWRGDQSVAPRRRPRQPIVWRSTSYQDLLSLDEPVPLSEMVKFLVEVWEEEL